LSVEFDDVIAVFRAQRLKKAGARPGALQSDRELHREPGRDQHRDRRHERKLIARLFPSPAPVSVPYQAGVRLAMVLNEAFEGE